MLVDIVRRYLSTFTESPELMNLVDRNGCAMACFVLFAISTIGLNVSANLTDNSELTTMYLMCESSVIVIYLMNSQVRKPLQEQ